MEANASEVKDPFNQQRVENAQVEKTEIKLKTKKENAQEKLESTAAGVADEVNGFAKKVKGAIVNNANEELLNGLRGFYAKKGDLLLQEAMNRNIKYAKLLDLNDLDESALPCDMFIYLEKKYKKSPLKKSHLVLQGESLICIAQAEAMQLNALRNLNMLDDGDEPIAGARIYLQEKVSRKPAIITAKSEAATTQKMKNQEMAAAVKSEEVNIANSVFTKQELENQKGNLENDYKIIPKQNTDNQEKVKSVSIEEIAEQQAQLGTEMTAEMKNEIATIEKEKMLLENEKRELENFKKEQAERELANQIALERQLLVAKQKEAEAQLNQTVVANTAPALPVAQPEIVVPVKPSLKSPSTYDEANVSEELHRLKKIMDEVVYAAPMPIKKKIAPAATVTVPAKQTTNSVKPQSPAPKQAVPANNPNKPGPKSTLPLNPKTNAPAKQAEPVKPSKPKVEIIGAAQQKAKNDAAKKAAAIKTETKPKTEVKSKTDAKSKVDAKKDAKKKEIKPAAQAPKKPVKK
jgi:hypothetical protein